MFLDVIAGKETSFKAHSQNVLLNNVVYLWLSVP